MSLGERVAQGLTLREPDAKLGALVPGPGDLVEDRRGVGAVAQVGEVDVVPEDRHGPDRRARQGIAFVPQGREIFPLLTVEENLKSGFAAKLGELISGPPEVRIHQVSATNEFPDLDGFEE